jgi:hypothetical protein
LPKQLIIISLVWIRHCKKSKSKNGQTCRDTFLDKCLAGYTSTQNHQGLDTHGMTRPWSNLSITTSLETVRALTWSHDNSMTVLMRIHCIWPVNHYFLIKKLIKFYTTTIFPPFLTKWELLSHIPELCCWETITSQETWPPHTSWQNKMRYNQLTTVNVDTSLRNCICCT